MNEDNNVKTNYYIDFRSNFQKNISLREIADSINYIILQFDKNNPVGKVTHFKLSPNFIFIADQQNKLFVFKRNGEIFTVLDSIGKGPNEYLYIADFAISDDEKYIFILDPGNKKVIKYTISGRYLISYPVKYFHAAHIEILRKGFFCIYQSARFSDDCSNIFITDSLFHLKSKIFYDGDGDFLKRIPYLIDVEWYRFDKDICFKEAFQSIVYKIDEYIGLKPYINIDFGNKEIPDYAYEDINLYQRLAEQCYQLTDIVESKNYIFIKVFYQNEKNPYLYIKKDNILLKLENSSLLNDLDNTVDFWPLYIDNNDIMYRICYADEINEKAGSKDAMIDFEEMVESNDNPIIVCVRLNPQRIRISKMK